MDPVIKVTRLGKGWGVRCFNPNGTIFLEDYARTKELIGGVAKELLRMYDKCGGGSQYAERARFRAQEKGQHTELNQKHVRRD